jgi:fructose 1,6-bisphosphatase
VDCFVCNCGDDLELIMTHKHGEDGSEIHGMTWNTFQEAATTSVTSVSFSYEKIANLDKACMSHT